MRLALGTTAGVETPRHLSPDEAWRFLQRFAWSDEQADYHQSHLNRYLVTMDRLRHLPRDGRVLEVGSWPYGLSLLLRHYLFEHLYVSGYSWDRTPQAGHTGVEQREFRSGDSQLDYRFDEYEFDCERHRWPFDDGAFGLVILCEIIEHLACDGMHVIAEANRALADGGRICITVPNVVSIDNILRLMRGRQPGILPYYRPQSVHHRHNRELSPEELREMLLAGGFELETFETVNFSRPKTLSPAGIWRTRLATRGPARLRRNHLLAIARKTGPVKQRYPTAARLYWDQDLPELQGGAAPHDDGPE